MAITKNSKNLKIKNIIDNKIDSAVDNNKIENIKRYNRKAWFLHLYLFPMYLLPLSLIIHPILSGALMVCSALLYLNTFWSAKSNLLQCYIQNKNGNYIFYKNKVSIVNNNIFICNRTKYKITSEMTSFSKHTKIIEIKPDNNLPINSFISGVKHENYGELLENKIEIPSPSFITLFKEQCVTPLFCFQIFSSLLMCFDEYILQSIFSTLTIIGVEAALVFSRVAMMKMFRTFRNEPFQIKCIRNNDPDAVSANTVSTETLKPGDVVFLGTENLNCKIPCDILLLEGGCATNEAMLSGESIPVPKFAIAPDNRCFGFKTHRSSVLFSGTILEQTAGEMKGVVLRTGIQTEQGILLNKMLVSEDIKYDPEALKFIIILSVLALTNCVFTFLFSKKRGYPLLIDILVLFTSSIPFELPMELGVSVQRAVKSLIGKKIYCLEPFRITMAGKVNVCCFDKTGTLTKNKMEVSRLVNRSAGDDRNDIKVLRCCHSLISIKGEIRGDPMDVAIYEYLRGLSEPETPYKIIEEVPFNSELKRQSILVKFDGDKTQFCGMKGAPEMIREFLETVPEFYDEYLKYSEEGYRVIALAYQEDVQAISDTMKRRMRFGGFVLFECHLQEEAREMCKILRDSEHRILMITGDNMLTAWSVARRLEMIDGQSSPESGECFDCSALDAAPSDGTFQEPEDEVPETRNVFDDVESFDRILVFARAEPKHKEMIIRKLRDSGNAVMMVGDGTNDVGALKMADVGVAFLMNEEKPKKAENFTNGPISFKDLIKTATDEDSVKPGDASVAAQLTVKSNSLGSIVEIIQQGRSTLVTTIQMYKIVALNAIVNAFLMCAIDILGVKFSEFQMLSLGILSSIAFTAISNSKPLSSISKERPLATIFSRYVLLSIAGQALVHIAALTFLIRNIPWPVPSEKFAKSLMNSAIFILSCGQTVSCLTCNYIGRPFRENISENQVMLLSVFGLFLLIANSVLNIYGDVNARLEIVSFSGFKLQMIILVFLDFAFCWGVERLCFRYFMLETKPKQHLKHH